MVRENETPAATLINEYMTYKYERIKARLDTDFKRYIGLQVADHPEIVQPKSLLDLNWIMYRVMLNFKEPLTEPLRNTMTLSVLKETIQEKIFVSTQEDQLSYLASSLT